MNYAPLTGAKFVLNINVGASPYAIICRPYGTYLLQSFLPDTNNKVLENVGFTFVHSIVSTPLPL